MGWKNIVEARDSSLLHSPIFTNFFFKDLRKSFIVINICGPYLQRKEYWVGILNENIFQMNDLICGRDLNFVITREEICGEEGRDDPLVHFFSHKLGQRDF
jgi:hypothetical protein